MLSELCPDSRTTITGAVTEVRPVTLSHQNRAGNTFLLGIVCIGDETRDFLEVLFWDQQASYIEKFALGNIVCMTNIRIKQTISGINGNVCNDSSFRILNDGAIFDRLHIWFNKRFPNVLMVPLDFAANLPLLSMDIPEPWTHISKLTLGAHVNVRAYINFDVSKRIVLYPSTSTSINGIHLRCPQSSILRSSILSLNFQPRLFHITHLDVLFSASGILELQSTHLSQLFRINPPFEQALQMKPVAVNSLNELVAVPLSGLYCVVAKLARILFIADPYHQPESLYTNQCNRCRKPFGNRCLDPMCLSDSGYTTKYHDGSICLLDNNAEISVTIRHSIILKLFANIYPKHLSSPIWHKRFLSLLEAISSDSNRPLEFILSVFVVNNTKTFDLENVHLASSSVQLFG